MNKLLLMDKVILKNLRFEVPVGLDAWRRFNKPQPVEITLEVQPTFNFEAAALQDDVNLCMDYGKLYKAVSRALAEFGSFPNIHVLMTQVSLMVPGFSILDIDVLLPKALLQATRGVLYRFQVDNSAPGVATATLTLTIKGIACTCIVGVNPHERLYKQSLFVDISVPMISPAVGSEPWDERPSAELHDMIQEVAEVCIHLPWSHL